MHCETQTIVSVICNTSPPVSFPQHQHLSCQTLGRWPEAMPGLLKYLTRAAYLSTMETMCIHKEWLGKNLVLTHPDLYSHTFSVSHTHTLILKMCFSTDIIFKSSPVKVLAPFRRPCKKNYTNK